MEVRPSSPQSVASQCELRALSPDSPVPHFDVAQIENYDQCFHQRSYTPQSSVSDWEGCDLCLTDLFDETRPMSPQSVSSDMELDVSFRGRALSPDSVSSAVDTSLLRDWLLDFRASSPESVASVEKCSFGPDCMFVQNNKHCSYYLWYTEERPFSPLSTFSDLEYSEFCLKDLFDDSRPGSPDSVSSENLSAENNVVAIAGQPWSYARPFTYADVVRGVKNKKQSETMSDNTALESQPILRPSDSFDDLSDFSTDELTMEVRPSSSQSVASQCELRALSPDSPVPHFDVAQIENYDQCFHQRSYTPQSSVSDWEGCDLCLTDLFDETRPMSPQSVSSDMELDVSFRGRALSPDSVSSAVDTSLLRDWLLDFRASSPESVGSVEKCSFGPDCMFVQNNKNCSYYLRYTEERPFSPLSTLSDVEYSEFCLKDLFDDSRPGSPDSVSSENSSAENNVVAIVGQPWSFARPFTYADVVRGVKNEKQSETMSDNTALESRPVLGLSDSFDDFSDFSTDELTMEVRPSSPQSVASQCELRALSPDSPVPHFDVAQIENYDQCFHQRSYTPQSSVSDWEGCDLCLTDLFDETRPMSPQSVSSDMELDVSFRGRALSPDSVSSAVDTSLLWDWLLDFRASSPESVGSVEKCSFGPDCMFVQNNKHCSYYLRYTEERPFSPLSTLSDVEYSEFCLKDVFDDSRPGSPDSVSSENLSAENNVVAIAGQPWSYARPFTYADVVRGVINKKQSETMSDNTDLESQPILRPSDSFDDLFDFSTDELTMEVRPSSSQSVASQCELRALSPDSPVPHFDVAQIENYDQCFHQRSYTPQSSVSDWEGCDLCLTDLFDETRPMSPQSVSSDVELDVSFRGRALSPDSVSSAVDTSLLRDWLLDFRASSPESVASVEKCSFGPDCMFVQNNKHCSYYLRYTEERPFSPLSTLSDVEYSEFCLKDLFDNSRPGSPDSVSSENLSAENNVVAIAGQPWSYARPFTYADVVRGVINKKQSETMSDNTDLESQPILRPSDSFDDLSDFSTDELTMEVRPSSSQSVASQCELRALSPDSPVPHFDVAQIENYDQCFHQRSYTPQSSVSDWEGCDLCLTDLFDETRPMSPQSVSSDVELDVSFRGRALSPDSVSSAVDTSLLRDWLLDFRASSPESVASVEKCSFGPDCMFVQNNKHCSYYLRYTEERPFSPLSTLSDVEYSEFCLKDLFDDSRPGSPDSVSSENLSAENNVVAIAGQPWSFARPFTYADVVCGFKNEKQSETRSEDTALESRPILRPSDSFDDLSELSIGGMTIEVRPSSPQSVASQCELRALSPDSPVPHFDVAQIENYDQCFHQRSYTPQSSVSDWEGCDLCLTDLFDETRPMSPQSVSSDMELDVSFRGRALSPDSVSSAVDTSLLRDWLLDFRASSPESVASVEKCSFGPDCMFVQNNKHCSYYLRYTEERPFSPLSTLSDVEYSEFCLKDLFDDSRPGSPDSVSSENLSAENNVVAIAGQPWSFARPFTYADVVRGFKNEKQSETRSEDTALESRPILRPSDSFDDFSDLSIGELTMEVRPSSPQSVASQCELRALSPDSLLPHFDMAQIENYDQCFHQRSYTPQSSVSDWEGCDLCLTDLFDETRPMSPQSVSSDMELEVSFRGSALSPDSVSSAVDTSLLRDWLLDFRASSPESVASVEKCSFGPDCMFVQNNKHCSYYLRYTEERPFSPLSTFSDVEYSEFCLKDLFDDSRPGSPDSVSSENLSAENNVVAIAGQPWCFARPFTYADVVRGVKNEKQSETLSEDTALESRPLLGLSDSFDDFSDFSTDELTVEVRPSSPQSVASQCELRALSPDSPLPHFDVAQIENYDQCFHQRSYTPQSSVSDWEGCDLCLTDLFDETRPMSPQSVSSDMELDVSFRGRALSPDSVSSAVDTSLLRDWLLDFRASSSESVGSVEKCSFGPDCMFVQNNKHCSYYLRYTEERPFSPLSTLSDVEYSEFCLKDLFDDSRPGSPDSVSSENSSAENNVVAIAGQPWSFARPFTYADVVRGVKNKKQSETMSDNTALESQPILRPSDSFDDLSDFSTDELTMEVRPSSPQSVASQCEVRALSPDSPVPHFDVAQIENYDQCFHQRSYTPQSSVSDWEGCDLCLTDLFDETRPMSPQSVSSDMELDVSFRGRALSPDSVSSAVDTSLLRDWLLDFRASSPESVASVEKCSFGPDCMFVQNNKHCSYYLQYTEERPFSPLSTLSDVEYSEFCLKDLFDDSRPGSPDSVSSENLSAENNVVAIAGQPWCFARPFTYADVVRGVKNEKQSETLSEDTALESRPLLGLSDSFDDFSDFSTDELTVEVRPSSPQSVASQCELRALSPDSHLPHFDVAQIENYDQCFHQRSYTPQSSVSDWEGCDLCLTDLFDETRPMSPQSVSSDMELDVSFRGRALSPDSVSSAVDTSLLRDWLLDFRASSSESVGSVEKCSFGPDCMFVQNNKHCSYYLRYTEERPFSPLSTLSDVEYSEFCLKDLFDDSRPGSPDSVSSENSSAENNVVAIVGQPWSFARPFTYADVVRGVKNEKQSETMSDNTALESRPVLGLSDSFDDFSDFSTDELTMEVRPSSPQSVASQCELRALSPDSPLPHYDVAQIENYDQCFHQRSYTPQSSVSDWEGCDLCLTDLFDETRPMSPQSVSSDMELDVSFRGRALSPDSVSSAVDTSLLRDWLLDFRASSPESVASVEKCSFGPDCMFVQNNKHCSYYLRYTEERPFSPLSTLSDVEYSEFCLKDLFDDSRPGSPDSVSSENLSAENNVVAIAGQPWSFARPFTYADVVRGVKNKKQSETMSDNTALESQPILRPSDSFDDLSDFSTDELTMEVRPSSPQSVASQCEVRALSPDSPVPHFDVAQIENYDQCFHQRSYTPKSSVSDWEGCDLCLTDLFDETRPMSPQSVSSDMELDVSFRGRALSPDSVSSAVDTSLLRDWLLDFRASSPESVASVEKCSFGPDCMFVQNNKHCSYYLQYTEERPFSPLSTLSDVEYSEFCLKDLFDDSRPGSPDSVSSENLSAENNVVAIAGQPWSFARPFTYADVVRGVKNEKQSETMSDNTALESQPILRPSDSFDDLSDFSTDELTMEVRLSSPQSVASQCELRALSPDSPVPHFDVAQIENYDQCFHQRSYTPQSSVSDWEGCDLCLTDLFDETRPMSPQSVSSDMELDVSFRGRALSPDSVSSAVDTSLLRDWLLDFRASSPESVASVEKCSFGPDCMFVQNNKHCSYYLRYTEERPFSPLSTLSDVEYSEFCLKDLFDDSRPESPDSVSSENVIAENKVVGFAGQLQSRARHVTLADVSSLSPVLRDLHPYQKFISPLFEPLYKGQYSSFKMFFNFNVEQQPFHDPQPVPSYLAVKQPRKLSLSCINPSYNHLPENPSTCLTDKCTAKFPPDSAVLSYFTPKYSSQLAQECKFNESFSQSDNVVHICEASHSHQLSENVSVSPDSSVLHLKFVDQYHDEIKPDSPKSIALDSETHDTLRHQNMVVQSFSDSCFSNSRQSSSGIPDSVEDSVQCLKHQQSQHGLIGESVPTDQRLAHNPIHRRLMAHIFDPVYKGKHVCDTVMFSLTTFDRGFEKTFEQNNFECLTAIGETQFVEESCYFESMDSIEPPLNEAMTGNASQPELSSMPSVEENMDFHHTVKVMEAFSKQTQTRSETMEPRPLLLEHEGTDTISPLMMTHSQDVLVKDMKRQSVRMDKTFQVLPEINAEIGSMSESSDDEFLSTRIVQRRVVIQADEMPDLPTQTVTEEKYRDENGHIVVKKVTRKIIRKCVSSDGVEREEVSVEGSPQRSISVAEGDGYSKVVKRTVLKSEGDHTEVTFAEREGFSASQETAEVRKVSLAESTIVVEGKRTVTHKGDLSLDSDLPSAQEDFKQALGYIGGFTRAELPHVVESETVKDDGTVVTRAHMRKGQTVRRTVVQGAGQRKQVFLEQVDGPTKGSKPHELQQHLHQLFHHYYEEHQEDHDDDNEDEEERE
ncbi:uncharacterized protein ank2a isoform X1 [Phycodurus eques]|uniref:uncharacterized protein ank2a isoform X1 n=1 Tax=Phycodurus eques TaxID=693459 RepID=UPI002ACD2627|nr:uncharacterized protein ank2a isoform X1 [Phycodurus eques]